MDHLNLLKKKVKGVENRFGSLAVHFSDFCQLKCSFCELPECKEILSPEILKKAKRGNPLNFVVVGGGEPTNAPKNLFKELITSLGNTKSKLITNGVSFPDVLCRIKNPFYHVRISLDAGNKSSYKKLKGLDVFDQVMSNIEKYLSIDAKIVCIDFVITEDNILEIPEIILLVFNKFFINYPEKIYIQFKLLVSYFSFDLNVPKEENVKSALSEIKKISESDLWINYFIKTHTNFDIIKYSFFNYNQRIQLTDKCYASQVVNILGTGGEVFSCPDHIYKKEAPLGNLKKDKLSTIFKNQFNFFNNFEPRKCESCKNCSKKELNAFLEKVLHSKYDIAPSNIGMLSAFDTLDYFYTKKNLDALK